MEYPASVVLDFIANYFWPYTRIAAMLMVMTVTGARFVPARVRLYLGLALTFAVMPAIPAVPSDIALLSLQGFMITFEQIVIGVAMGIALFLTFFIMAPVFNQINEQAVQPYLNEQITARQAFDLAQEPLKAFMLKQTRVNDLETFVEMSGAQVTAPEQVSMAVLIPAFITSELKTAFQIGFMLFLPFLIIDLVVASVLMAMGMMMLSPMIVSLPFKLMLFVLVDGWNLILSTLAGSFAL